MKVSSPQKNVTNRA